MFLATIVCENFPSGQAIPGASVTVYATGTTTKVNLYTFAGASINNPFDADSNGRATFSAADATLDVIWSTETYVSPTLTAQLYDLANFAAEILALQGVAGSGQVGFATLSAMNADLNYPANTIGVVFSDPTPSNDGTYLKAGGSGSGSWSIASLLTLASVAAQVATVASNLASETSARVAGDATLTSNLASETSARISGDATLTSNLASETSARVALSGSLASETAARIAGDGTLSGSLASETAARIAGDANLASETSAALASETSARIAGDATLTSAVALLAGQTNVWVDQIADNVAATAVLQTSVAGLQAVVEDPTAPNSVFAGPTSGSAEAAAFRALVMGDLPALVSGAQSANSVYAGPASGGATAATFRALTAADMPAGLMGGNQGAWNAATNSPHLTSSTGTVGYSYTVSVAGTTSLDGIASWAVGDQAVFAAAGAWTKIPYAGSGVSSVAGRTGAVTLGVADISGLTSYTPAASMQEYSGSDSGSVDNDSALAAAVAALPANAPLRFPYLADGFYEFASAPVPGTLIFDADESIVIQSQGHPSSAMRLRRNTLFTSGDPGTPNSNYFLAPKNFGDLGADKNLWITASEVDNSRSIAIDATSSFLLHTQFTFGSDTIASASPASTTTDKVTWALSATNPVYFSTYAPATGDRLAACFPTVSSLFYGCVGVFGAGGYQILYFNSAGVLSLLTKAIGEAEVVTTPTVADPSYQTYLAPYSRLEITIVSATQFILTVDGQPVFGPVPVTALGRISGVGFGCFGASTSAVNVPIQGWVIRQALQYGLAQKFTYCVIGDAISDPSYYGQWPAYCTQALDGSLGMRCTGADNRAVADNTSAQQLTALTSAGVGTNLAAVVAVGSKDIQDAVTVGEPGVSGSYADNIYQIFNIFIAAGIPVVGVVPPLFYAQSFSPGGNKGQNVANYGGGAPYRIAMLRVCARLGVKIVDTQETDGLVVAGYTSPADPWLRDNYNPTGMASRVRGYAIARALAALIVPQPVSSASATAAAGTATTLAALAALTPSTSLGTAVLTQSGRFGTFAWISGNLETLVANDPGQGIYVAWSGDSAPGATGAWVRQYSGNVNLSWFGALGDAVLSIPLPFGVPTVTSGTDNSTALNNWAIWARYQSSLGIPVSVDVQPPTGNGYLFDHSKCQGFLQNIKSLRWYNKGAFWLNINTGAVNTYNVNPWGELAKPLAITIVGETLTQNWYIQQTTVGAIGFSFVTATDAANISAGSWVMLGSLDVQYGGYPNNCQQFEYVLVSAINTYASASVLSATYTSSTGILSLTFASAPFGAGVGLSLNGIFVTVSVTGTGVSGLNGSWGIFNIASAGTVVNLFAPTGLGTLSISGGTLAATAIATTEQAIRYEHRVDYPDYGVAAYGFVPCGVARVWATTTGPYSYTVGVGSVQTPTTITITLSTVTWDIDHEYHDLYIGQTATYTQYWSSISGRKIKTVNFKGVGFSETVAGQVIHEGARNYLQSETDKLVGSVTHNGLEYVNGYNYYLPFSSASEDRISLTDSKIGGILQLGSCKSFYARNCDIGQLTATAGAGFRSEAVFQACRIFNTQYSVTLLDACYPRTIDGANLSFSNGIFSMLKSAGTSFAGFFGAVPGQTITLFGPGGIFVGNAGTGIVESITENSTYLFVTTTLPYATLPLWALIPGTITPGSGGSPGTYAGVSLTGGSGTGMTANITVGAGGGVTAVTIVSYGSGYLAGNILSASSGNIGGASGFLFPLKASLGLFTDAGYDMIDCTGSDRVRSASFAYKKGLAFWEYRRYEFAGNYSPSMAWTAEIAGNLTQVTVTPIQVGANSSAYIDLIFVTYNSASNYAADSGGTVIKINVGVAGQRVITQSMFAGQTGSDGITVGGAASSYLPANRVVGGEWIFSAANYTANNYQAPMFLVELQFDCGIARKLFPVNAGNTSPPLTSVSGVTGLLP